MDSKYPNRDALLMPSGSMDANGYFHLSRKAIHVVPAMEVQQHRLKEPKKPYDHAPKLTLVRAVDKSIWEVADDSEGREDELGQCSVTQAYMVLLGWFNEYSPGGTSAHDADNIWMMLVEEHAAKLYHLWSFVFWLDRVNSGSTHLLWVVHKGDNIRMQMIFGAKPRVKSNVRWWWKRTGFHFPLPPGQMKNCLGMRECGN